MMLTGTYVKLSSSWLIHHCSLVWTRTLKKQTRWKHAEERMGDEKKKKKSEGKRRREWWRCLWEVQALLLLAYSSLFLCVDANSEKADRVGNDEIPLMEDEKKKKKKSEGKRRREWRSRFCMLPLLCAREQQKVIIILSSLPFFQLYGLIRRILSVSELRSRVDRGIFFPHFCFRLCAHWWCLSPSFSLFLSPLSSSSPSSFPLLNSPHAFCPLRIAKSCWPWDLLSHFLHHVVHWWCLSSSIPFWLLPFPSLVLLPLFLFLVVWTDSSHSVCSESRSRTDCWTLSLAPSRPGFIALLPLAVCIFVPLVLFLFLCVVCGSLC